MIKTQKNFNRLQANKQVLNVKSESNDILPFFETVILTDSFMLQR